MPPRFWMKLKNEPAVLPVFLITIGGAVFCAATILRSCIVYSDVSFRRKSNPHPWLGVKPDENRKFLKVNDYKSLKSERPVLD